MPIVAVIFLTLVNLLNYFDRYIVQAVEPTITQEFSLSNTQAGYVVSAFVIGYCFFSPIFGFLGDRFDRRKVMALGLVAWSCATWLTASALTALGFIGARILVGVGEACYGAIVPVYLKGRIADTVALNRALSVFYVAIPVGSALGYVAGGQVAAEYGWRALFSWAAIPGVLLAIGFLFLRPEVSRGSASTSAPAGGVVTGLRKILASPLLVLLIAGYVLNTFALNGVAAFVVRHGTTLGLGEAESSTYFGLILVVTGLGGTLGGGFLASRFAARSDNSARSLTKFVAYSTLAAVPFLVGCFLARSPELFLTGCFLAELLIFAGVAPLNSVIVERAPQGYEAFTQGVTIFSIQMFGGFLGPVIVGALTDAAGSLGVALQGTSLALLASGYLWMRAIKHVYVSDQERSIDGRRDS
jgi:MFS transporter, Spinster family, sphingosine-1-phosphate transporter